MYTEELIHIQRVWSEKALFLMREMLPLMTPVAMHPDWQGTEQQVLGEILAATARTTESVLLLTSYGQLWDADVMVRSVCEGTLKFVYILQSKDDYKKRIKEFDHDLFEIAVLKDDTKARELLKALTDPDSREWKPIRDLLVTEDYRAEVYERFDKKARQVLEQKWGFTGLISALSNSGDPLFRGLTGLLHGYSTASHVHHADSIGVAMPLERDRRSEDERNSVHLAHLNRLISDGFTYFKLRLIAGYRFIDHPKAELIQVMQQFDAQVEALNAEFGDVYEQWMDIEYPRS